MTLGVARDRAIEQLVKRHADVARTFYGCVLQLKESVHASCKAHEPPVTLRDWNYVALWPKSLDPRKA